MARPSSTGPTRRELALLKVLWRLGPSTGQQLREQLAIRPKPAYTSLLTNLQSMLRKGLVTRDKAARPHVYAAGVRQEDVEEGIVQDLVDHVFNGSASRLVAAALSRGAASPDDLRAIEALLRAYGADAED